MTQKRITLYIITAPRQQDLESSPGGNRSNLHILTLSDCVKQVNCPTPCEEELTTHTWKRLPSELALAGNSSGRISEAGQQTAEWNLTLLLPVVHQAPDEGNSVCLAIKPGFLSSPMQEEKTRTQYLITTLSSHPPKK